MVYIETYKHEKTIKLIAFSFVSMLVVVHSSKVVKENRYPTLMLELS